MREVNIGSKRFTKVVAIDEPDQGGACHEYVVSCCADAVQLNIALNYTWMRSMNVFARVSFQNGPIKEHGVNGCHHEDLLAIVIDRLRFSGPFACRENALAITKLEEAMHWMNHRTSDRQAQGVEGTNKHREVETS